MSVYRDPLIQPEVQFSGELAERTKKTLDEAQHHTFIDRSTGVHTCDTRCTRCRTFRGGVNVGCRSID